MSIFNQVAGKNKSRKVLHTDRVHARKIAGETKVFGFFFLVQEQKKSIRKKIVFERRNKCCTMCDFHNYGLIFTGQCTVCLKG